jgi:O-antigen/teichoic acid export membrane protein
VIRRTKAIIIKNKILLENFSFLSVLQVSNLLIFLLTIPYLFRVLGKENYGLVVFAQTIAIYFSIIVNFGFTVTGTRDISISRDNHEKVNKIISLILTLKSLFFMLSLFILTVLILFIPLFAKHPYIFYFSMLFCLSEALFPIWYFQGIEKMKYITFINIGTRVISAISIFHFIKNPEDYVLVPVLLGIGTISGVIVGLFIVFRIHNNSFKIPTVAAMKSCFVDNIPLFISNVSSQIYVNANKLIVGSFLGMQEVAIYDVADKIVNLVKVPVLIVGQTLFPRVSRTKNVRFVKSAMWLVFIFFLFVYSVIFLFANQIIALFTGSENNEAASLLRLLAASILPVCLGLFFAELLLVPFGKLRDYAKMRSSSSLIYIFIIGALIYFKQIGLYQMATLIIVVETFVLLYSFYLCKKNKII